MKEWVERFELKYSLTIDDYYMFNLIVFDEAMRVKRQKQTAVGIISVLVAAIVLSTFFITSEFQVLFLSLSILLTIFGIYSILFYPIIFPKQLKKAVEKKYDDSDLENEEIFLQIHDGGFTEHSGTNDVTVTNVVWKDVDIIYISDFYVVLIVDSLQGVLIPSRCLNSISDTQMKGYIINKAKQNNIRILFQK